MQANKVVIRCKNCSNVFSGQYCNHCGQDAHTGKLDFHFLMHEIQHGLLHADKGILFTIKELFIRPGHMLREFIAGKRVKHSKPLTFLVLITGLDAFINHYLHLSSFVPIDTKDHGVNSVIEQVNEWSASHYILQLLLQLPLLSYVFYLLFRKYKTSYPEHLVINCYLSAQKMVIRLILLPMYYLIPGWSVLNNLVIPIGVTIWAYSQYYHKEQRGIIIQRAVFAYTIFYFLIVLMVSVVLTMLENIR